MKLLYLSCHAILEYDELKLFEELGVDYFSLGSYIDPRNPADPIRPALTKEVDPALYNNAPLREAMPRDFIDQFDIIFVMDGSPAVQWIGNNWENMKHKRVILRTIGQSNQAREESMKKFKEEGMQVVRYSPREEHIPSYIGSDALIRFYKDPEEFKNWNGNNEEVITFAQNMQARGEFCNTNLYSQVVQGLPAKIYGPKNEAFGVLNGGFLSYEDMKTKMQNSRAYLYTGTQPASYTLSFMEAFMTGIPMVCIGPSHGNSLKIAGSLYEVGDLIDHGVNGFVSDNADELRGHCRSLLENKDLAENISVRARRKAIDLFGKDGIKKQWKEFLEI
jgi:hypothetical protein